jgi:putative addiction module component (TIGR02574 family)
MSAVSEAAKKLLEQVLALAAEDQEALVDAVEARLANVAPDLHPEWRAEIDRRIAEVARGEVQLASWEDVHAAGSEALRR